MSTLKKNSISYWKDKLEDLIWDVGSFYQKWLNYIRYRTTRRYHIVDTKLEPGYYESDERLLHASFSILVDFVEVEAAWMKVIFDDTRYSKLSWIERKFGLFRSAEDGVAYLNHQIEAGMSNNHKEFYKDTLFLYDWWTKTRPQREDPFVLGGYYELYPDSGLFIDEIVSGDDSKGISKKVRAMFKRVRRIEDNYNKEDEQMLIRLIKIRKSMWT
jgi:hypothetical protein